MNAITGTTGLLCLIGDPVSHSLSPYIHNSFIEDSALDLVYMAFQVKDLARFFDAARELGIRGFNVTMPHKQRALELCDWADDLAASIGAANTVVLDAAGKFRACNTDGLGALGCIVRAGLDPNGLNALVLGAGGAARALAASLALQGAHVMMATRHPEDFGKSFVPGATCVDFAGIGELARDADLIANATPLGMEGREAFEDFKSFSFLEAARQETVVFDMVYSPIVTRLLSRAQERGMATINGLDMLLAQAVESFALFCGVRPGDGVVEEVKGTLAALYSGYGKA